MNELIITQIRLQVRSSAVLPAPSGGYLYGIGRFRQQRYLLNGTDAGG